MTQRVGVEAEPRNAALASLRMLKASPKVIKNTPDTDKVFKELICFFFMVLMLCSYACFL